MAIPTYNRVEKLEETLKQILRCSPLPNEIIIHIDYGDCVTEPFLLKTHPEIVILISDTKVGPGGGRTLSIQKAKNNLIASFDDDSYPIDIDYFDRLHKISLQYPNCIAIEGAIFHINEKIPIDEKKVFQKYNFTGCGTAYHRNQFLETGGYVPVPLAYGMEEVDLSLRAYDRGLRIIYSSHLRIFHNTLLNHHSTKAITAASISNLALLTSLRYPTKYILYGLLQVFNRVKWLFNHKRINGIGQGLISIPLILKKYRKYRNTVKSSSLKEYLMLRDKVLFLSDINENL